jgi:hypothetical protein
MKLRTSSSTRIEKTQVAFFDTEKHHIETIYEGEACVEFGPGVYTDGMHLVDTATYCLVEFSDYRGCEYAIGKGPVLRDYDGHYFWVRYGEKGEPQSWVAILPFFFEQGIPSPVWDSDSITLIMQVAFEDWLMGRIPEANHKSLTMEEWIAWHGA